ncbi:hypothetical protein Tco_0497934 [Tanacetum coccineum]
MSAHDDFSLHDDEELSPLDDTEKVDSTIRSKPMCLNATITMAGELGTYVHQHAKKSRSFEKGLLHPINVNNSRKLSLAMNVGIKGTTRVIGPCVKDKVLNSRNGVMP